MNERSFIKRSGLPGSGSMIEPGERGDFLFRNYKIYCAPIHGANVHGCRITPNVYTSTEEFDVIVKALSELEP